MAPPDLECRMYESHFPEPDDVVMVLVKDIQEMGAYVHLLEYGKVEGMIMLSELSRRRIRSVNKLLRVGRQEVVAVLRVDKEKGYIDLSKRRVAPEDIAAMEEKWNKSRTVHSIMRHVAETVGVDLEELYTRWGWPLYRKYGHCYDAFREAVQKPDEVLQGLDISELERAELLKNVERKLTPQPMRLRADIEVTCLHFEGIDAIKAALRAGEQAAAGAEYPVKIKLVAPPLYVVTTTALAKTEGIALLNKSLASVKEEIEQRQGRFTVKVAPRSVSEKDDRMLSSLMDQLESENKQVDGDEADEEGYGEGGKGEKENSKTTRKKQSTGTKKNHPKISGSALRRLLLLLLLPLVWGPAAHLQGVYVRHGVSEGVVDAALAVEEAEAFEGLGNDHEVKTCATAARDVADLQVERAQGGLQGLAQFLDARHG
eukprot:CAMPEP_0198320642 /NCGR_PEP_ID=MMETSP1450-20131203/9538_1 /TAXON_ID=753684 ORGANISM="Madagascaria erythrocladiodes, Strain CCMP3234" /NCGR_SAMPLE_ID=MMETSP1450 /ASSEMBLY_ACC=CAM_ASM_001115 /LENGTH=428 /DNA_ID=CAMNT_0044024129 /DNA_START=1 /DNA_END=1285 /DNA_ORIENTATION=-